MGGVLDGWARLEATLRVVELLGGGQGWTVATGELVRPLTALMLVG